MNTKERLQIAATRIRLISHEYQPNKDLRGDAYNRTRQRLIEVLTGEKKPLAQCGIHNLMSVLYESFGVDRLTAVRCQWELDAALSRVLRIVAASADNPVTGRIKSD